MANDSDMKNLWAQMAEIFGHKWTSQYGDTVSPTWKAVLIDLSPEAIATGLRKTIARSDPWPPSLPEFRAMCLDIPELEEITQAIFKKNFRNPLALTIKTQIGSWDLQHDTEAVLRKKIAAAYEIAKAGRETATTRRLNRDG